ncbi:hypothetical protein PtA15_15A3 [Puccinia triticina]|uniref:Uncharacterized protein n=1 Tax=Puccinia triticina TaxID=208348 RepID=A0ABY7D483_9BASI|nr:uncharacterized protein PtA15_15A3 [Puccinia triticina]WAQ91614.1 hypothetical protein PtA15_15A3 [Puccinia triticina]
MQNLQGTAGNVTSSKHNIEALKSILTRHHVPFKHKANAKGKIGRDVLVPLYNELKERVESADKTEVSGPSNGQARDTQTPVHSKDSDLSLPQSAANILPRNGKSPSVVGTTSLSATVSDPSKGKGKARDSQAPALPSPAADIHPPGNGKAPSGVGTASLPVVLSDPSKVQAPKNQAPEESNDPILSLPRSAADILPGHGKSPSVVGTTSIPAAVSDPSKGKGKARDNQAPDLSSSAANIHPPGNGKAPSVVGTASLLSDLSEDNARENQAPTQSKDPIISLPRLAADIQASVQSGSSLQHTPSGEVETENRIRKAPDQVGVGEAEKTKQDGSRIRKADLIDLDGNTSDLDEMDFARKRPRVAPVKLPPVCARPHWIVERHLNKDKTYHEMMRKGQQSNASGLPTSPTQESMRGSPQLADTLGEVADFPAPVQPAKPPEPMILTDMAGSNSPRANDWEDLIDWDGPNLELLAPQPTHQAILADPPAPATLPAHNLSDLIDWDGPDLESLAPQPTQQAILADPPAPATLPAQNFSDLIGWDGTNSESIPNPNHPPIPVNRRKACMIDLDGDDLESDEMDFTQKRPRIAPVKLPPVCARPHWIVQRQLENEKVPQSPQSQHVEVPAQPATLPVQDLTQDSSRGNKDPILEPDNRSASVNPREEPPLLQAPSTGCGPKMTNNLGPLIEYGSDEQIPAPLTAPKNKGLPQQPDHCSEIQLSDLSAGPRHCPDRSVKEILSLCAEVHPSESLSAGPSHHPTRPPSPMPSPSPSLGSEPQIQTGSAEPAPVPPVDCNNQSSDEGGSGAAPCLGKRIHHDLEDDDPTDFRAKRRRNTTARSPLPLPSKDRPRPRKRIIITASDEEEEIPKFCPEVESQGGTGRDLLDDQAAPEPPSEVGGRPPPDTSSTPAINPRWRKNPDKMTMVQIKADLDEYKVKYLKRERKPQLTKRWKDLAFVQSELERWRGADPHPKNQVPPSGNTTQNHTPGNQDVALNTDLSAAGPQVDQVDDLIRLSPEPQAPVNNGNSIAATVDSFRTPARPVAETSGSRAAGQWNEGVFDAMHAMDEDTPDTGNPSMTLEMIHALNSFTHSSREWASSIARSMETIAGGVSAIQSAVGAAPLSSASRHPSTSRRRRRQSRPADMSDNESTTGKGSNIFLPTRDMMAEIRVHCACLFGKSAQEGTFPPPATEEERRRWIVTTMDDSYSDSDSGDSQPDDPMDVDVAEDLDTNTDPVFPFPDGPGHKHVSPQGVRIIWNMMRRAGVKSFRPDLSEAFTSPMNTFLWNLAVKTFIKLQSCERPPYENIPRDKTCGRRESSSRATPTKYNSLTHAPGLARRPDPRKTNFSPNPAGNRRLL